MNRKLIVVSDLGRLKAFQLEWTIQKTPRLLPLEKVELEEAHHRVIEMGHVRHHKAPFFKDGLLRDECLREWNERKPTD